MTYATLMVHLELFRSNADVLAVAGDMAERFGAAVIGLAPHQPLRIIYSDGFVAGGVVERDRRDSDKAIADLQAQFLAALERRARRVEWRSAEIDGPVANYAVHEARSADLLIVGTSPPEALLDPVRRVSAGDFVMQLGRPVLVVPAGVRSFQADRVLVGWKDTREARRAVADALPILKKASEVTVTQIVSERDISSAQRSLDAVVSWLNDHRINANAKVVRKLGDDTVMLDAVADEVQADLMVAGAYGHSRFREWMLGGVTRDLLTEGTRCTLLSH